MASAVFAVPYPSMPLSKYGEERDEHDGGAQYNLGMLINIACAVLCFCFCFSFVEPGLVFGVWKTPRLILKQAGGLFQRTRACSHACIMAASMSRDEHLRCKSPLASY